MSAAAFAVALVAGAGALAVWVDVRFPRLAPAGIVGRVGAAAIASAVVALVPLHATVASLIGLLLPALCFAFLTTLWLLRLLAEARG